LNIPQITKRFETSLASALSAAGTSFTLESATDEDGNALSGLYGLTIDVGNSNVEDSIVTISGNTATVVFRGIDADAPNTEVAANKQPHRRGAPVVITDFPILAILRNILNGDDTLPNKLSYASNPSWNSGSNELATVKFVEDTANAGAANASTTVKGIVEEATQAEIDADTAAGGTSARLAINPSTLATSKYGTRLPTANEKAAIAGQSGTAVSGSNKLLDAADAATAATANKLARRLATGDITVPASPTNSTDAASKSYVDSNLGQKLDVVYTDVTSPSDTNENTLYTKSIPAATLGTNNAIRLKIYFDTFTMTSNGTFTFRLKYGSTTVVTLTVATTSITNGKGHLEFVLLGTGAATTQEGFAQIRAITDGVSVSGIAYSGSGTAAENSANALNLVVTTQSQNVSTLSGTVTLKSAILERIR